MVLKDDFIGQYRVIKHIAQTQACCVYLVHCDALDTQLIVKLALSSFVDPINAATDTSFFIDQAKLMHKFSGQKHIVNLMHIGVYKDELNRFARLSTSPCTFQKFRYIVMPYYPQTLADKLALQQQKLSLPASIECIEQLLVALTSLHALGVLHLDIKPQNVFIDHAHQYFLGDFDNAKLTSDSPLLGQLNIPSQYAFSDQARLTVKYASPEQFASNSPVDAKSDLYSLGVLAYRLLTGKTLPEVTSDSLKHAIKEDLQANNSPPWLTELIGKLTQSDPNLRVGSAQACLQIIQDNMQQAEDEATIVVSSDDIYSENTRQLSEQIALLLLRQGYVLQGDKDKWSQIYLYDIEQSNTARLDLIRLLIDEIKQVLISDKGLGNWFGWANHLQLKQADQGRRLIHQDYQQTLQAGIASRTDSPDAAIHLMASMFTSAPLTTTRFKRFALPSLFIIVVYLFWAVDLNLPDFKQPIQGYPAITEKNMAESPTANTTKKDTEEKPLGQSPDSVWAQKNASNANSSKEKNDAAQSGTLQEGEDQTRTKNTGDFETEDWPMTLSKVDKQKLNRWRYQLPLNEKSIKISISKATSVEFEMVKISPKFAVMRNEVTHGLYQMCIDEGSCRKVKKYSTAIIGNRVNLSTHPMVNISWYEVTQEFMPWLNKKTNITFSLPRIAQWQQYAKLPSNRAKLNQFTHCRDCTNRPSISFRGSTISVNALPSDALGLVGVRGNAQEWLLDCNVQHQIERCDQAIVIGGSWIDNLANLQHSSGSALLKRAATPTTGFRLIEVLND